MFLLVINGGVGKFRSAGCSTMKMRKELSIDPAVEVLFNGIEFTFLNVSATDFPKHSEAAACKTLK
jgi:hypothetical protein